MICCSLHAYITCVYLPFPAFPRKLKIFISLTFLTDAYIYIFRSNLMCVTIKGSWRFNIVDLELTLFIVIVSE